MSPTTPQTFRREGIDGLDTEVYSCVYFGTAFSRREAGKELILIGPDVDCAHAEAEYLFANIFDKALGNEVVLMSPKTFRRLLTRAGLTSSAWREVEARPTPSPKPPKPAGRRRQQIFEKSDGKCHYCKCALELDGKWHVEHKMPRALGGDNDPVNLVASCAPCNYRKGDKTDIEFSTELANALASMKEKA